MAAINDKFFTDLAGGASWAAGVSFQRSNPLPLDKYSVFQTKVKAEEYATTNPVAYPGQVIALVEADKTTIFYIDQEKQKQEVGASLSADGKTVVINNGNITLANMPTDTTKTYNATLVNGVLTWTEPSATTVEGLDTRLTAAEKEIDDLNAQIDRLKKRSNEKQDELFSLISKTSNQERELENVYDSIDEAEYIYKRIINKTYQA